MRMIRFGSKVFSILLRDSLYYPSRLVVDTITMIARCGVLLILYAYVFRLNGGEINGTLFSVAAWSMFFYFVFSSLRLRDISQMIMRDVQSGTVETLLGKPVSYLAYRIFWQIGSGLYSFLFLGFFGTLLMMFLVGIPASFSFPWFVPTLIATVILGGALSLLMYSAIGLLAFWIEDANPVFWMVDKSVMILGGSYLPVALFPKGMYLFAVYSPFGASQFVTHTVYATWAGEFWMKLGIQLFWVILFSGIVWSIFSRARRKVSVNGG